jgi:hypothetical protein
VNWIVAKIRWIMLVAGALTCSMFYAAVKPDEAVEFLFDRTVGSAFSQVLVADWAALVGLVGAMLVYGAFVPKVRMLVLTVAGAGKLAFLGLMIAHGREYLDEKVSIVLGLDAVMVTVFVLFAMQLQRMGMRRGAVLQETPPPAPRVAQTAQVAPRPALPSSGTSVPRPPPGSRHAA